MKRIDDNTVEHTDFEMIVEEIHSMLVDQGYDQGTAVIMLRGSNVPEALRTPTPFLDEILTPDFVAHLCE